MPLYTLRDKVTGETTQTSDAGTATVTGSWADVGKFKREPAHAFVFASIFKDPKLGWFVFFYVQPPRTTTAPR